MMRLTDEAPTISELAEHLNISSPGVTQMIDKLQAKGYVERKSHEKDQRLVRVQVTAEGRKALQAALVAFETRVNRVLSPLEPEEREELLRLFLKLDQYTAAADPR
jgi:DNA-binding MarR family transcriptional regulator